MKEIDIRIQELDKTICDNIALVELTSRGLISQNLLAQSRTLLEHIAMKAYSREHELNVDYTDIKASLEYIKHDNKYLFLRKFHNFLQESRSHYGSSHEGAERLVLKYYKYFVALKNFVKKEYNMDILSNLNKFPIKQDGEMKEYYREIVECLKISRPLVDYSKTDRFYVRKSKSFIVGEQVYYENVLVPASDTASKTDRFVAFSTFLLPSHYAINALIYYDEINVKSNKMPVNILVDYKVSIRPCELNNYAKIWGKRIKISSASAEYVGLMNYLTKSGVSLTDIVLLSEDDYINVKVQITQYAKSIHFMDVLDISREFILHNGQGSNVIRYLLATLNNRVLKRQYAPEPLSRLGGLYLKWGCIPFDDMPFASGLLGHMPELSELYACISDAGREHELLGRFIQNNTKANGKIYTEREELEFFNCIDELMLKYNNTIYDGHPLRKIGEFGKNKFYITENVVHTEKIIKKLLELSEKGILGYKESVSLWLEENDNVDSEEKRDILKNMFDKTKVSLIYGAAGTGKTYLINHISQYWGGKTKLFLANTHPAVENLRRSISAQNNTFMTIKSFISKNNRNVDFDILIIDECSMVSNSDMNSILSKINCKLMLLVGDTYQIEAIDFGNWFSMSKYFLKDEAWYELETPYRTKNKELLNLWKKVRNLDDDITEYMVHQRYSSKFDDTIFEKNSDDEIILCLNYDGLYGINNINRFLQSNNPNPSYRIGVWTYKVGDPILFNESERFMPIIYNNLKGTIVSIEPDEKGIYFSVELEKAITELDAEDVGLELCLPINEGKSVVRFYVNSNIDTDEDNVSKEEIIPFQVSYAVSIHKAQGLEYDSVKILITEEIDEMINHNIFYTAITRSKNLLKVYWSAETQEKIISGMDKMDAKNDANIFSAQTGIKMKKSHKRM